MNCRATGRKVAIDAALKADIARIDELWQSLRQQYASEGPWLFGRFSIADCMYAPVALRFTTYQVDISDPSREYVETILSDPDIQAWLSDASAEPETIEIAELGKN